MACLVCTNIDLTVSYFTVSRHKTPSTHPSPPQSLKGEGKRGSMAAAVFPSLFLSLLLS